MKLTKAMDQMYFTGVYRTFHPKSKGDTFSSAPHGTFSITDSRIGHKIHLNNYKKFDVIPCLLLNQYGLNQAVKVGLQ